MTVFERNDRVGGLLQYGIPTMKLSKEVVQRRVKLLAAEGIEFKTNINVGKDIAAKVSVPCFSKYTCHAIWEIEGDGLIGWLEIGDYCKRTA